MRTVNFKSLLAAAALVATAQPVIAQTWMADGGKMRISARYREGNEIRVETFGINRRDTRLQFSLALQTVAKLAHDKGFPGFALTKVTSCGTMTVGGVSQCRLVARMLRTREDLPVQTSHVITYYDTEVVLRAEARQEVK